MKGAGVGSWKKGKRQGLYRVSEREGKVCMTLFKTDYIV